MSKKNYTVASLRTVSLESGWGILASSVVTTNSAVIVPHGQKVETYDFSDKSTFVQEWDVTPPTEP